MIAEERSEERVRMLVAQLKRIVSLHVIADVEGTPPERVEEALDALINVLGGAMVFAMNGNKDICMSMLHQVVVTGLTETIDETCKQFHSGEFKAFAAAVRNRQQVSNMSPAEFAQSLFAEQTKKEGH